MTQSSSNGTTSTSTRTSSSQNVGNINYGYGYTTDAALRRTGDNTAYPFCERETFFEIGMYEIEASGSNSAFEHAASVPATRPDVHNSLSPFNGVDADFTDYQDAELIRQNEQRAIVASPCSSQGSWVDVDRPEYDPFMEFQ